MKQYMSKTRGNYGSGVARPKIDDKTHFELKGQFLKELCENTFNGSKQEDANEHIEKVLEIVNLFHILEISKVLQERGFRSLSSSTETNPRDHVKSISTAKADSTRIRHIGSVPYAVSDSQYSNIFSETVPFPRRLHDYCCEDWKEAREVMILETYDHTLPQKEKDP
nr:hypothetical protein [Tanacetum cinerariifolium]